MSISENIKLKMSFVLKKIKNDILCTLQVHYTLYILLYYLVDIYRI